MPTEMVLKTMTVQRAGQVGMANTRDCEETSSMRNKWNIRILAQQTEYAVSIDGLHSSYYTHIKYITLHDHEYLSFSAICLT